MAISVLFDIQMRPLLMRADYYYEPSLFWCCCSCSSESTNRWRRCFCASASLGIKKLQWLVLDLQLYFSTLICLWRKESKSKLSPQLRFASALSLFYLHIQPQARHGGGLWQSRFGLNYYSKRCLSRAMADVLSPANSFARNIPPEEDAWV